MEGRGRGRATIGWQGAMCLTILSNHECALPGEAGSRAVGGSSTAVRGTTQTRVKAPKFRLSAEIRRASSS